MKLKNLFDKVSTFTEQHWLFILLYFSIMLSICIYQYNSIADDVERSKRDINTAIKVYYGGEKGMGYNDDDNYSIVSFQLTDKPSPEGEDSSIYAQIYGTFENYYVATSQFAWSIEQYLYVDGKVNAYIMFPCAVGVNNTRPEDAFRALYHNLCNNYEVNKKPITLPKDLKEKYHYLEGNYSNFRTDTIWFNDGPEKKFYTKKHYAIYSVCEDDDSITYDLYFGLINLILLETFLFALFWFIRRSMKKFNIPALKKLKDKINLKNIKSLVSPKSISENSSVSDTEYEVLLHKINPINFMNPYDAEKVKVANDLYSALLKSRDNETIIRMIEEKAKAILKI